MIHTREDFRPHPRYPTYPPYHTGDYIEDYFYKRFVSENPTVARDYIGISWTTLYCQNEDPGIQEFLNSLDPNGAYFTICQHDDAPKHVLPKNTIVFSLSRSKPNPLCPNFVVIPAVCSPVPKLPPVEKDIFASFVGSITHPIRQDVYNVCKNYEGYYFSGKPWSPVVTPDQMNHFLEITKRSKFALCPRGYGNTSFRMYEAMQMNTVPVYISDDFYIPWADEINWGEFCIFIPSDKIEQIDQILKNITDEEYNQMVSKMKDIYPKYFTLDGTYQNILRRIQ